MEQESGALQTGRVPTAARALSWLFAMIMLAGAAGHVIAPEFYAPLVPPGIPLTFANVAATLVEAVIGVMLMRASTRARGALAFCALMVAFLPIHVWDLLKEQPAVGSHTAATIRLVVQVLFIAASAWVARSAWPDRR